MNSEREKVTLDPKSAAAVVKATEHGFSPDRPDDERPERTQYRCEHPDGSKSVLVIVGLVGAYAKYYPADHWHPYEPTEKAFGTVTEVVNEAIGWGG